MAHALSWKVLIINLITSIACDFIQGPRIRDLILYYDFEKISGQTVFDMSGNNHTAKMNTRINITHAKCGEGIMLNEGSLRVNTSSSNRTARSNMNLTIAVWIFLNEKEGKRTIFASSYDPFLYFGINSEGMLRAASDTAGKKNNFKPVSNRNLATGVWHHVALSYSFKEGEQESFFYINGVQYEGKCKQTCSRNKDDGALRMVCPIGCNPVIGSKPDGNESLYGILDEYYMFNRTLNKTEIEALKNATCKFASTPKPTTVTNPIDEKTSVKSSTTNPVQTDLERAKTITEKSKAKEFLSEYVNERIIAGNISTNDDDTSGAMKITDELETIALTLARNTLKFNQSLSLETPSALILMNRPVSGFTFPVPGEKLSEDVNESISFPDDIVKTNHAVPRIFVSMAYSNLHKNLPEMFTISTNEFKPNTTLELRSNIIGSAVHPPLDKPLTDLVMITFSHGKIPSGKHFCSFWNHTMRTSEGKLGEWSTKGCQVDKEHSTTTKTVCLCNHLTNFALLLQREGVPYRDPPISLKIITVIGSILSILACLLCFLMFFTLKKRDIRHHLHVNLAFAIAIAQFLLLFGIARTENKILCKTMSAFLHYFYLVAFMLMLCEGAHLAILIETAFSHGDLKLPVYLIGSWGLPLIVVGITLGARYDNYGSSTACFISAEQGTVYAFVAPFAVILLINFIILILVLRQVIKKTSFPVSSKTASKLEIARATIRSLVILFPVMGFTWVFGILFFAFRTLALEYLFAIFCSLQGFFIFLFQYALNSENRTAFVRATRRWRLTLTSSTHMSASGLKQTGANKTRTTSPNEKEVLNVEDNCHLVSYRTVDDKTVHTLDSKTTSTFV